MKNPQFCAGTMCVWSTPNIVQGHYVYGAHPNFVRGQCVYGLHPNFFCILHKVGPLAETEPPLHHWS